MEKVEIKGWPIGTASPSVSLIGLGFDLENVRIPYEPEKSPSISTKWPTKNLWEQSHLINLCPNNHKLFITVEPI